MKYSARGRRDTDFYSVFAIERAIRVLCCFSFQEKEHTMGELV